MREGGATHTQTAPLLVAAAAARQKAERARRPVGAVGVVVVVRGGGSDVWGRSCVLRKQSSCDG